MMMNYDGRASCLSPHRGFSITGPGGFMVQRGGGASSAMVGGVELDQKHEIRASGADICVGLSLP